MSIITNTSITLSLSECFEKSIVENKKTLSIFDKSQLIDSFKYPGLVIMINNALFNENISLKNIDLQGLQELKGVKPISITSTNSLGKVTNANRFSFQPTLIRSSESPSPLNNHGSRENSQSPKFNINSDHFNNFNGFTSNLNINTTPVSTANAEQQDIKRRPPASTIIGKLQNQAGIQKLEHNDQSNQNDEFSSGQYRVSFAP